MHRLFELFSHTGPLSMKLVAVFSFLVQITHLSLEKLDSKFGPDPVCQNRNSPDWTFHRHREWTLLRPEVGL
jgi:hypothetical protein